jgi:hypothetical protein
MKGRKIKRIEDLSGRKYYRPKMGGERNDEGAWREWKANGCKAADCCSCCCDEEESLAD